jgi:hypothetical protein
MFQRSYGIRDILKILTGFADPRTTIESMIKANIHDYRYRAERVPERDPNAWLAQTLGVRLGNPSLRAEHDRITSALSLVKDAEVGGPTALSVIFYMAMIYRKFPRAFPNGEGLRPKRWQVIEEYIATYNDLLRPVRRLARTGRAVQRWRDVNPWTACCFPDLHENSDESDWDPMADVVTNTLLETEAGRRRYEHL